MFSSSKSQLKASRKETNILNFKLAHTSSHSNVWDFSTSNYFTSPAEQKLNVENYFEMLNDPILPTKLESLYNLFLSDSNRNPETVLVLLNEIKSLLVVDNGVVVACDLKILADTLADVNNKIYYRNIGLTEITSKMQEFRWKACKGTIGHVLVGVKEYFEIKYPGFYLKPVVMFCQVKEQFSTSPVIANILSTSTVDLDFSNEKINLLILLHHFYVYFVV